ncbi:MAG TPA: 2Fe-2S iron-sulfur cluster-binding protein, partial [Xanthobacteraceae bacterium]
MTGGPAAIAPTASRLGQMERADTLALRNARLSPGAILKIKVSRTDTVGAAAGYQEFAVPYQKWMRVLDALNTEHAATDLAYRWFCGSKMCGTWR